MINSSTFESLYHATLGGAKALDLDDKLGNFNLGKEADFVVLDLKCNRFASITSANVQRIEDALFALMTMGDDRNIHATYIFWTESLCVKLNSNSENLSNQSSFETTLIFASKTQDSSRLQWNDYYFQRAKGCISRKIY